MSASTIPRCEPNSLSFSLYGVKARCGLRPTEGKRIPVIAIGPLSAIERHRERVMSSRAALTKINAKNGFLLLVAVLFWLSQTNTAIAQQTNSLKKDPSTQALAAKPADRASASGDTGTRANAWVPPDVDRSVPEVTPGATCSLSSVLSAAGKRIEELVRNVDKFTATEVVEHQSVDRSGRLGPPQNRNFNYLVTMAKTRSGGLNVEEYRNGGSAPEQFPDHIATVGTPSLALIFHPHHVDDFEMKCEGLGQWRGKPAWQVRFEERTNRRNAMMVVQIGGGSFSPRLRGEPGFSPIPTRLRVWKATLLTKYRKSACACNIRKSSIVPCRFLTAKRRSGCHRAPKCTWTSLGAGFTAGTALRISSSSPSKWSRRLAIPKSDPKE